MRVEGAHEALITYDDFMAVRNMISRDTRMSGSDADSNMFSGFLFCADCKQPMIRKVVPSKNKKYHYFICSSHKRHDGCSAHSMSSGEIEKAVMSAISSHIANILDLSDTLEYIERLPSSDRKIFNYEAQMVKLEEEIEHFRKMKLRIYEDLTNGVIDKKEYADFRNQYSEMLDEKSAALERVRREKNEVSISGETEKVWVTLFRQYENIEELSRRVLMALVDKILIYENHSIEVFFRYGDEFNRMSDFVREHEHLLTRTA